MATLNPAAAQQPGAIDPAFDTSSLNSPVQAWVQQSDGKWLIGGSFTMVRGALLRGIARLHGDGSTDETFAIGMTGANGTVYSVGMQSDGKILIGGSFTMVNQAACSNFARLNADGTVDETFNNAAAGADGTVLCLRLQTDGKVIMAGTFTHVNGTATGHIARLNPDGTLDSTFADGLEGANGSIQSLAVQEDGKIVIGGSFNSVNGAARNSIARLNSDGTLDNTFGETMPGADLPISSVVIQHDGMILIGGYFKTFNGTTRGSIARLNADGTLDNTFGKGLAGADAFVVALAAQDDGKILIGGSFSAVNGTVRNRIARLNCDGTLDSTFGDGLTGADAQVCTVALQQDGEILIGGLFSTVNGERRRYMARLNADGALDGGFTSSLVGPNNTINTIALQHDGKILIGGGFTAVNEITRYRIARLNADGTLDRTFGEGLGGASDTVRSIAVQRDGRVLVAGDFLRIDETLRSYFARLNPDGARDMTFATWPAGKVHSVTLQNDGKILIGGDFYEVNGTPRNRIARLNPDGTLDNTFGGGLALAQNLVQSVAVQTDGKILIGGVFPLVNGAPRGGIARLNQDGTLDNTFGNELVGAQYIVNCVTLQSDGKVLIGGQFGQVNGTPRGHRARLNEDGTLDDMFGHGLSGANGNVHSIVVESGGKILVGGAFTRMNGTPCNCLARLNPDGTLDTAFVASVGGSYPAVYSVAMQADGKVLIGGTIGLVNGVPHRHIARLWNDPQTIDLAINYLPDGSVRLLTLVLPVPSFRFEASTNLADWEILTTVSNPPASLEYIDSDRLPRRYYRGVCCPKP